MTVMFASQKRKPATPPWSRFKLSLVSVNLDSSIHLTAPFVYSYSTLQAAHSFIVHPSVLSSSRYTCHSICTYVAVYSSPALDLCRLSLAARPSSPTRKLLPPTVDVVLESEPAQKVSAVHLQVDANPPFEPVLRLQIFSRLLRHNTRSLSVSGLPA